MRKPRSNVVTRCQGCANGKISKILVIVFGCVMSLAIVGNMDYTFHTAHVLIKNILNFLNITVKLI